MATKITFDKRSLIALKPRDKLYRIGDPKKPGLKLVVHPSGSKTWSVVKRSPRGGAAVSRKLGGFPNMTIHQARAKADEELSAIASGINRNQQEKEVRQANITLGEARLKYLALKNVFEDEKGETYFKKNLKPDFSPGSIKDYRTFIRVYMADWANTPLSQIDEIMIADRYELLKKKHSLSRANSAIRIFRAIYNLQYHTIKDKDRKPILPPNPALILGQTKRWKNTKRRKDIIRRADLPAWVASLNSVPLEYAGATATVQYAYIKTMLYTGLRPSHLLPLTSSYEQYLEHKESARGYYDVREKLFYFYTQKNDVEMEIPVSLQVAALIEGNAGDTWAFETITGKALNSDTAKEVFRWIKERSGVHAMPNVLRRTFLTIAEAMDLSHYAYKTLVGHKIMGGAQDVTAGYISSEHDRLRRAAQMVADRIDELSEAV